MNIRRGRLIVDEARPGAINMAADEALLQSAQSGVATLRFYRWSEPTLSLGYFQAAGARDMHAASRNCPMVRRSSGGGAIVHDHELTYSLSVPAGEIGRTASANQLYRTVHAEVVELLRARQLAAELQACDCQRQPFLCFQRRADGDIICGAHKIMGSAQRRVRSALAQHGSLLLARSEAAPELPGIAELAGSKISADELIAELSDRLANRLGIFWQPGDFTDAERDRAEVWAISKYASQEWCLRR